MEQDALKDRTSFIADVGQILSSLSRLMEENKKIRADFGALSKITVTKEQMLRHTALLSEVDSCLKRLAAENKRLDCEMVGLRRPDRRVGLLGDELKLINRELERIRSELGRPPAGLLSRISAIEQKIENQDKEIEKLRARVDESSHDLLKHKLRAGKRKFRYKCD